MRPLALAFVLGFLLFPTPARAQFKAALEWVAIVGVYSTHTEDGTTCKPDAEALTTEAELILRRSGITVDDDAKLYRAASDVLISDTSTEEERRQARILYPHSLSIGTASVYVGGRCAVSYSIELARSEVTVLGPIVRAIYFNSGGVWSGPSNAVSSSIRETVRSSITELANEILKARQEASR